MQTKILSNLELLQFEGEFRDLLIYIVDPREESVITPKKDSACEVLLKEFNTDEVQLDEDKAPREEFCKLRDVKSIIHEATNDRKRIYIYAGNIGTSAAASIKIGIDAINSNDLNETIYNYIDLYPSIRPNYWIIALFDYALGLRGQLTSQVDDLLATGLVISKTCKSATADF